MKKIIFSLVVLSLLIQFPVFATETEQEAMSATLTDQSAGVSVNQPAVASMNQSAEVPVNQSAKAAMPGAGKLGNSPQNQMVLTNDGGVIVLAGFRLLKYDADLKFVKEVSVPLQKPPFPARDKKPTPTAEKADQPVATELQEKVI